MFSLQSFFSKDDKFLDLLEGSAKECRDSVAALQKLLGRTDGLSLDEFIASRRRNKQISNEIAELLCRTSITGLEREDIEALANSLYKIPKTVEKFAERYILFSDRVSGLQWQQHVELLAGASTTLLTMVKELRSSSELEKIKGQNDILQKVEGDADKLMLAAFGELCSREKDPVTLIVVKDLYELLEKVVDRCRDTGIVISNIVLKNS